MAAKKVRFTASVPFARFAKFKKLIENCDCWTAIDDKWSFFETQLSVYHLYFEEKFFNPRGGWTSIIPAIIRTSDANVYGE